MLWTREQYLDLMRFRRFDRPMFIEPFGPLIGLDDEWRAQGATEDEINMTAFDFDFVDVVQAGANCAAVGLPESVLLEETEAYRIERDGLGRTTKLIKGMATLPLPLDFPVETMDDWLKLKPHYAYCPGRIDDDQVTLAVEKQKAGSLVIVGVPGAYDTLRRLMGEETAALACYDQPEMIVDIFETLRDTSLRVLDELTTRIVVDEISVHEDMAGKSGPMLGPKQMQEFVRPYFQPIFDLLKQRGTQIIDIDSDGNVEGIMDDLLDCGFNHLHPMEPAAGMDIVASCEKYGQRWAFNGGLDKFAVIHGPAAIDAELETKLTPEMLSRGGLAFGLDHRIPNGTPLEHYRYYVRKVREIIGLPPLDGTRKGWGRMAI